MPDVSITNLTNSYRAALKKTKEPFRQVVGSGSTPKLPTVQRVLRRPPERPFSAFTVVPRIR